MNLKALNKFDPQISNLSSPRNLWNKIVFGDVRSVFDFTKLLLKFYIVGNLRMLKPRARLNIRQAEQSNNWGQHGR